MYAFAFYAIIFIYIKLLFNSRQNPLQRIEKSAGEKKNTLKKRNIRLTIINALNMISCFKFIQIFLTFISINRFTFKENQLKERKIR